MEPRSFERGEGGRRLCRAVTLRDASMEPRSFERGELNQRFIALPGSLASMEPRSFERGEL